MEECANSFVSRSSSARSASRAVGPPEHMARVPWHGSSPGSGHATPTRWPPAPQGSRPPIPRPSWRGNSPSISPPRRLFDNQRPIGVPLGRSALLSSSWRVAQRSDSLPPSTSPLPKYCPPRAPTVHVVGTPPEHFMRAGSADPAASSAWISGGRSRRRIGRRARGTRASTGDGPSGRTPRRRAARA